MLFDGALQEVDADPEAALRLSSDYIFQHLGREARPPGPPTEGSSPKSVEL